MTDSGFPYGIGAEYDSESDPQDFEIVEIPAYTYAVFTVRGRMPDAFRETYRKICTEFFPQSGYEYNYTQNYQNCAQNRILPAERI